VSPDEAIIRAVFNTLTLSPELQAALGGTVRLYHTFPDEPETVFPYAAHTLNIISDESDSVRERGTYILDIWDYYETKQRLSNAVSVIRDLLHRRNINTPNDSVIAVRFFLERGNFIQEDEPNIHRYSMSFTVRWIRNEEIQTRLGQP
jgi:hypothetical protein